MKQWKSLETLLANTRRFTYEKKTLILYIKKGRKKEKGRKKKKEVLGHFWQER